MKPRILILLLALTATAHATDYHVDRLAGDNANPGTSPSLPFKTVAALDNVDLFPGDRVLLNRNATHSGTLKLYGDHGTPGDPILVTSYGEHSNPVANPRATLATSGAAVYIRNSSHIEIVNLTLISRKQAAVAVRGLDTSTVDPEPSEGITVRACEISGGHAESRYGVELDATLAPISGVSILGNSFHNIGASAVYGRGSLSGLEVSGNLFQSVGLTRSQDPLSPYYRNAAIKLETVEGATAEGNVIRGTEYGVFLTGWGTLTVRWNTIEDYLPGGKVAHLEGLGAGELEWCSATPSGSTIQTCCNGFSNVGLLVINDGLDPCGLDFPPTPTPTSTPTPSHTPTPTPWPTWTPPPTWTPVPTWTPAATWTPSSTPTPTPEPEFPPPASESVCTLGSTNWTQICLNEEVPPEVDCDTALTVGRSLCYYGWTTIELPLGADGSAACGLTCPYCEEVHVAAAPAEPPRALYDRTDDLFSWFRFPADPETNIREYTCSVRCPECGRVPPWLGRFEPIYTTGDAQ